MNRNTRFPTLARSSYIQLRSPNLRTRRKQVQMWKRGSLYSPAEVRYPPPPPFPLPVHRLSPRLHPHRRSRGRAFSSSFFVLAVGRTLQRW